VVPCIYRIRVEDRFVCGARPPLACTRGVCPFGPTFWERLIKHDTQSHMLWIMPELKIIRASELDLGSLEPGAYIVKSVSLSAGRRRRCRSDRR